jgi:hypothetical protein
MSVSTNNEQRTTTNKPTIVAAMSLSFVSSAVLSSTDGVSHNEEKAIESKEVKAVRARQEHKPLFEQLRSNREEEESAREELQQTLMRGTRALDEEDCAHLDALQREQERREQSFKIQMEDELALFRAAKADRAQADLVVDDEGDEEEKVEKAGKEGDIKKALVSHPSKDLIVPVFVKRRRRQPPSGEEPLKKIKTGFAAAGEKEPPSTAEKAIPSSAGGLGGLLGGYGSSDSDRD